MSSDAPFARFVAEHREVLEACSAMEPEVTAASRLLVECLQSGGQVILCGNGGSSSDAQHFAGELVGRFLTERRPLPALALSGNEATLTAIGNDYGYDEAFSRQAAAFCRPGDLLVAISTSGNSPNIVRAAEAARANGCRVLGMTGAGGGHLAQFCDALLAVPSRTTARVQEMHILMIHAMCAAVDDAFPA